jgi:hypothetical protein
MGVMLNKPPTVLFRITPHIADSLDVKEAVDDL